MTPRTKMRLVRHQPKGSARLEHEDAIREWIAGHPLDGASRIAAGTGAPLWLCRNERKAALLQGAATPAPRGRFAEDAPELHEPADNVLVSASDDADAPDARDERIRDLETHIADLSMDNARLRRIAARVQP